MTFSIFLFLLLNVNVFFLPFKGPSPCAANNGGCSHFCVVKTSGYECVCPAGLALKPDGRTCKDSKLFHMYVVGPF